MRYLFIKSNGLVDHIIVPGTSLDYIDGDSYGEYTARRGESIEDAGTILTTWHWTGTEFSTHLPNTNPDFIWDSVNFTYKEPDGYIDIVRNRTITKVNNQAGIKITSLYPIYKQLNISRNPTSQEALAMYLYIDSIRSLSNIANFNITSAAEVSQIREIETGFTTSLSLL